jgi:hypothetical protein
MSECKQDDSCRQHRSAYEQAGSGFILNVSNQFPEGLVHYHSPLQVLDQAEELLFNFQLLYFIKYGRIVNKAQRIRRMGLLAILREM